MSRPSSGGGGDGILIGAPSQTIWKFREPYVPGPSAHDFRHPYLLRGFKYPLRGFLDNPPRRLSLLRTERHAGGRRCTCSLVRQDPATRPPWEPRNGIHHPGWQHRDGWASKSSSGAGKCQTGSPRLSGSHCSVMHSFLQCLAIRLRLPRGARPIAPDRRRRRCPARGNGRAPASAHAPVGARARARAAHWTSSAHGSRSPAPPR
jgi:hypothetical protein